MEKWEKVGNFLLTGYKSTLLRVSPVLSNRYQVNNYSYIIRIKSIKLIYKERLCLEIAFWWREYNVETFGWCFARQLKRHSPQLGLICVRRGRGRNSLVQLWKFARILKIVGLLFLFAYFHDMQSSH